MLLGEPEVSVDDLTLYVGIPERCAQQTQRDGRSLDLRKGHGDKNNVHWDHTLITRLEKPLSAD